MENQFLYLRTFLAILAVYRITVLLIYDDGPRKIFYIMREKLPWRVLECAHCMGVWVSLVVLPLILLPTVVGDVFLLWMAIAGGQSALERL